MPDLQSTLVKRYGALRLYDTIASRSVSVDELRRWRERDVPFEVRDAETGADITRALLA